MQTESGPQFGASHAVAWNTGLIPSARSSGSDQEFHSTDDQLVTRDLFRILFSRCLRCDSMRLRLANRYRNGFSRLLATTTVSRITAKAARLQISERSLGATTVSLILASASSYRRDLLARLGVPFECHTSGIDENKFKADGIGPIELARTLATEKAVNAITAHPLATIIGCDQLVDIDGRILGKPGSFDAAVEQLSLLAGRSHRLVTAICVWHNGGVLTHIDLTTLVMRPLAADAISRYLMHDQPFNCSGSYRLESRGITLFERIESDDNTAIIGLPLIATTTLLKRCGYEIP